MGKRTQSARLIAGLLARSHMELHVKHTAKSRAFDYPDHDGYLYVGKAGSLRYGPNRQSSVPHNRLKRDILASEPE